MARNLLTLGLLLAASPLALSNPAPLQGPKTLTTRFSYKAAVPKTPPGARALDLWLPLPSDNPYQKVSDISVTSPLPHRITQEKEFGNRMVYVHAGRPSGPFEITVAFTVERTEVAVFSGSAKAQVDSAPAKWTLDPDAKVPIGGRYGDIATEVTAGKTTALAKSLAAFDHVVATMEYDYKKESPHFGDGDVPFVCDYKKGNCSDLHSYIISLLRSEGIPAFLEYGFPIAGVPIASPLPQEGKIGGYHCWTWFQDEQNRWIPLDASDGRRWRDSGDGKTSAFMFGNLILERSAVAMSRGRDLTLEPAQKQGPLNYFVYPYAEADGQSVDAAWELTYRVVASGGGDVQPSPRLKPGRTSLDHLHFDRHAQHRVRGMVRLHHQLRRSGSPALPATPVGQPNRGAPLAGVHGRNLQRGVEHLGGLDPQRPIARKYHHLGKCRARRVGGECGHL